MEIRIAYNDGSTVTLRGDVADLADRLLDPSILDGHEEDYDTEPETVTALDDALRAARTVAPFSGDWEWDDNTESYRHAYAAVRYGKTWNGFVTPVVTRPVLDAFVARQADLRAEGLPVDAMRVNDDGTLTVENEDSDMNVSLKPVDGLYDLGNLGYTFTALDEGESFESLHN